LGNGPSADPDASTVTTASGSISPLRTHELAMLGSRSVVTIDAYSTGSATLNIGKAARASGVPSKTIRCYESIGLISAPLRTRGGYRVYSDSDVNTLRFLHRARDLGFSTDQIWDLLALWRDRSRASKKVALARVQALDEKAQSLTLMSRALRHLAEQCKGDDRPECPIIDEFFKSPFPIREPMGRLSATRGWPPQRQTSMLGKCSSAWTWRTWLVWGS
jgi:Cu(I)-responsive transcriptional regulator